jgi:hypothetical protein
MEKERERERFLFLLSSLKVMEENAELDLWRYRIMSAQIANEYDEHPTLITEFLLLIMLEN